MVVVVLRESLTKTECHKMRMAHPGQYAQDMQMASEAQPPPVHQIRPQAARSDEICTLYAASNILRLLTMELQGTGSLVHRKPKTEERKSIQSQKNSAKD